MPSLSASAPSRASSVVVAEKQRYADTTEDDDDECEKKLNGKNVALFSGYVQEEGVVVMNNDASEKNIRTTKRTKEKEKKN